MLRTLNAQPTLWEAILPEMCLGMPAELEAVDRLLDDPAFFEPFRAHFHAALGRPSLPIETYLRLMFLKYRYRLGFEPIAVLQEHQSQVRLDRQRGASKRGVEVGAEWLEERRVVQQTVHRLQLSGHPQT